MSDPIEVQVQPPAAITVEITPTAGPAAPVLSVFGRVGAVLAQAGDYAASLLGNDSFVPGATVKAALESLYQGLPSATPGSTLHLYVDPLTGNDANAGTLAAPVATTAGLAKVFPRFRFVPVVVHLVSAANYPSLRVPPSYAMAARCPVYVIGEQSTIVATGSVLAGSSDLVLNATVASKDLYQGMTLRMTSGAAASGAKRLIRNCTTTTITPAWRLTAVPATNDTFAIERPASVVTYTDSYTFAEGIGFGQIDSPLVLVNIAFQGPSRAAQTPTHAVRVAQCSVTMFGVVTQTGGSVQLVDSYARAGTLHVAGASQQLRGGNAPPIGNGQAFTTALDNYPDLGADVWLYQGWGIGSPFAAANQTAPLLMDRSAFVGCVCAGSLYVGTASDATLVGGGLVANTLGGGLYVAAGARCYIAGTSVQRLSQQAAAGVNAPGNTFWTDTGTLGLNVQVEAGGFCEANDLIANSSAAGTSTPVIFVKGELRLTSSLGGGGTLVGTYSGGCIAVLVNRGAKFSIEGGSLNFTYTGTAGNALEASSGALVAGLDNIVAPNGKIVTGTGAKISCNQGAAITWTLQSITTLGFSEFDLAMALSGTITLNNGLAGTVLTLDHGSKVFLQNLTLTATGAISLDNGAAMSLAGTQGTSTCTTSVSPMINVRPGCVFTNYKATAGTFQLVGSSSPAIGFRVQGELRLLNARLAAFTGVQTAVNHSAGGRVYVDVQPTNVAGTVADFQDTQGAFADGQLSSTERCIWDGQHAAGTYSAAAVPTGSAFLQRTT